MGDKCVKKVYFSYDFGDAHKMEKKLNGARRILLPCPNMLY